MVCAAPALGGWYRALTVDVYDSSNEVLVKFVDYGGYTRLPASDLKQIRLAACAYVTCMKHLLH